MAEMKQLNTRVQLKYDSYTSWTTNNPTLLPGEIAIAKLVDDVTIPVDQQKNAPVLFKVGPGAFNSLPWASALAADVYAWAKKENPDWSDFSDEIPGIKLGLIVRDEDAGKFVTGVTYDEENKTFTISRSDVGWTDIQNKPDLALKSDLPTDFGVTKITAEGDEEISLTVDNSTGEVKITADHKEHKEGSANNASDTDISGYSAIGTIRIPKIVTNAHGHVTELTEETVTIVLPNEPEFAAGDGLKLTSNDGVLDYSLNLALKLENDSIILHDKDDATKVIATLEANELLEDSYLNDVEIVDNELKFTWKMDDGSTKTDSVDLKHLVDVYDGENEGTIKVKVNNYKISAEVIDGTLEDKHIAANAAIAETKLAQGVQNALALARTALQSHQDISGKADKVIDAVAGNFAGLDENGNLTDSGAKASDFKQKQTAVENQIAEAAHVLSSLSQNENGDISYAVKVLTPADIGAPTKEEVLNQNAAILAEAQKYADSLNHEDTKYTAAANGGLKLNENNEFAIDDSVTFVFYCGSATELI